MRSPICLVLLVVLLSGQVAAGPASPTTLPTATETVPGTLIAFKMIKLPAGSVELVPPSVDAKPQTVSVKSIWIAETELTWEIYDIWAFQLDLPERKRVEVETRPSRPYGIVDHGFGHEGFAAIGIHSHAARLFCEWLSEKTGKTYRLPTEAEWEYACRAGGHGEPFKDSDELSERAWFYDNSLNYLEDPVAHRVGTKQPNAWGLYDMLGNAAEWVMAADGAPVIKGGSFRDKLRNVHSRFRSPFNLRWQATHPESPKSQWWLRDGPHVGFRIVRED